MPRLKTISVRELNEDKYAYLEFVSDSQDVEFIKEYIGGRKIKEFDAFFVAQDDGDYSEIWGIYGIIPNLSKTAYKLR